MKAIFIVLCRTGTVLSRAIGKITGDWFTHASVSLDGDLATMYSFGRLWAYNPWIGGFVKESVAYGTMRRFRRADTAVIKIMVTAEQYEQMQDYLTTMYAKRRKYHYNYRGLFLSPWKIRVHKCNRFYCSEFVTDFLERFGLIPVGALGGVVRPMQLLKLVELGIGAVVYRGALCQFSAAEN
ncbi:MAG: hypothetical protein KIG16_05260 [Eubacteriales bacterium]|nr:hypothetical protein [Eubacteriales bacterium]